MTISAPFIPLILISLLVGTSPALGDQTPSPTSKAHEYLQSGEYEKGIDELRAAASRYPYDDSVRADLVRAYVDIAQRDVKATRYAQAAEYLALARDLAPDEPELSVMRGIALYLDKKYDAARADLEQGGDEMKPLAYLGKISYDTGDLPAAIAYWKRAQEKAPGEPALAKLIEKAERELPVESRMDRGYSSMFDLSYDAELPPGLAAEVLDALESAYSSVGGDLGLFPATRIPVLLYTKSDYSSVTAGPIWSGGLYDGKIRLPIGGITNVTPQLRGIIFHEFTHVLISQLTGGNIPTWLNEGLAQIEERKEFVHPGLEKAAKKNGAALPLSQLSGSFLSMNSTEAATAYLQSYSLTSFMVSRYGWYRMQGILKNLGERTPVETAVAKALADYSLDLAGVMAEWEESLSQ